MDNQEIARRIRDALWYIEMGTEVVAERKLNELVAELDSELPREHSDGGYTDSAGQRHKRGCPTRWYDPCTCEEENQ